MRCAACHTENPVEDAGFWVCSCGWICPIVTANDSVVSFMERLDMAMDRLRDAGMPCTSMRLGPAARALLAQGLRGQPAARTVLDTGETYTHQLLRYRNVLITTHATNQYDRGGGRVGFTSDEPYHCYLGVNQARPLMPRWLMAGLEITNGEEVRIVEVIDERRGIVSTAQGQLTFEQLRDRWRAHQQITITLGQLWEEVTAPTAQERAVAWRVQRIGAVTVHLISSDLRIVPIEDLVGANPKYRLMHDAAVRRGPAPAPRDPVAVTVKPRAPYVRGPMDILADEDDIF